MSDLPKIELAGQAQYLTPKDFIWSADGIQIVNIQELLGSPEGELYDLLALYGSTHSLSTFRTELLEQFPPELIKKSFNPQVAGWDPSYVNTEAWVLAHAKTVLFRLENKGIVDGGLGSMTEMGFAIGNAISRGQRVIVSLEEDLEDSLETSQALAQYISLKQELADYIETGHVELRIDKDVTDLGNRVKSIANQPANSNAEADSALVKDYQGKKEQRIAAIKRGKRAPLIAQFGTSDAYATANKPEFNRKNKTLDKIVHNEANVDYSDHNDGIWNDTWTDRYDQVGINVHSVEALLKAEKKFKMDADLLEIAIYSDGTSNVALGEIGFRLADALATGQEVIVLIEDFNPNDFVLERLMDILDDDETTSYRELFENQNHKAMFERISEKLLGIGESTHIEEVRQAIEILLDQKESSWKDLLKIPVIKSVMNVEKISTVFRNADNSLRVRRIAKGSLQEFAHKNPHVVQMFDDYDEFTTELEIRVQALAREFGSESKMEFADILSVPEINSKPYKSVESEFRPKGYPERVIDPDNYQPHDYTAPTVAAQPGWADQPLDESGNLPLELMRNVTQKSEKLAIYQKDPIKFDEKNRPINPAGRTGIEGRGLLGKWGPNYAADPIITRTNPDTGLIEMLVIKRSDSGRHAIPGGMVDPGEKFSATAIRELKEETGIDLTNRPDLLERATTVYEGVVDDPRNTDNAWMVTSALHLHLGPEESNFVPKAGDDASDAKWLAITPELLNGIMTEYGIDDGMYADHEFIVRRAMAMFYNANSDLGDKAKRQLTRLKKDLEFDRSMI